MAEQNYYDILGVSKEASQEDIKQAYKKLARQYHPDLNPGNTEAAEKFKKINAANDILSDANKRKQYDMELAGFGGMGGMGGGGFSGFGGGGGDFFSDLFSNVFGGGFGGGRAQQEQATDVERVITISFVESLKGVHKSVAVSKMDLCPVCSGSGAKPGTQTKECPKCHGKGRVQSYQQTPFGNTVVTGVCDQCRGKGKIVETPCVKCFGTGLVKVNNTVEVDIPAGVQNGQIFSIRGGGNAVSSGAAKGDLVIQVNVGTHKYMKRQGNDIYMDLPISLETALLGGKLDIPTAQGMISYDFPEGTQNGQVFTLRRKGVAGRGGTGDLYIRVTVDIPKLDRKGKIAFSELQKAVTDKDYKKMRDFDAVMSELK